MLRFLKGAFFLALPGTIFVACDKELSQADRTSADEMTAAKEEPVRADDKSAEPMSYEIGRDDITDELMVLMDEEVNGPFLEDHPNASATIKGSSDPDKYTITIKPGGGEQ